MATLEQLKKLAQEQLLAKEIIEQGLCGVYEKENQGQTLLQNGALFITDRQLVLLIESPSEDSGFNLTTFSYDSISSLKFGKSSSGYKIIFIASGSSITMKQISDENIKSFAQTLRLKVAKNSIEKPSTLSTQETSSIPSQKRIVAYGNELKNYHWFSWVSGAFLVLMGLVGITQNFLQGLLCLGIAGFLFPPIRLLVYRKIKITVPTAIRVIGILAILGMIGSLKNKEDRDNFQQNKTEIIQGLENAFQEKKFEYVLNEIKNKYPNIDDSKLKALNDKARNQFNLAQAKRKQEELERKKEAEHQKMLAEQKKVLAEQQRIAALTLEDKIKELAIKTWGKTTIARESRPRIINIEKIMQLDGEDKGGYLVKIQYRADDDFSNKWIKNGIMNDAMELIQAILASSNYDEVKIVMFQPYFSMVDKYGKESEDQVAKISIRLVTAQKINWKNITTDMFERIVQEEQGLWIHPAMR